jgi:hypothetical protein
VRDESCACDVVISCGQFMRRVGACCGCNLGSERRPDWNDRMYGVCVWEHGVERRCVKGGLTMGTSEMGGRVAWT